MINTSRRPLVETGITPVELVAPALVSVSAERVAIDSNLVICERQAEIENAITGLMAIGMTNWEAMISMISGGLAVQADFGKLDGIPNDLLYSFPDILVTINVLDGAARRNWDLADRCLNLILAGVSVDGDLDPTSCGRKPLQHHSTLCVAGINILCGG